MSLQTLDQRRAKHAWEAVQHVKEKPEGKKFGNHARKLPTRIMASGLGQAMAFLYAKKYSPLLLQSVSHWTLNKTTFVANKLGPEHELIKAVISGGSDQLRMHTAEALAYLQWLVRFAEAEGLMDPDGGND